MSKNLGRIGSLKMNIFEKILCPQKAHSTFKNVTMKTQSISVNVSGTFTPRIQLDAADNSLLCSFKSFKCCVIVHQPLVLEEVGAQCCLGY